MEATDVVDLEVKIGNVYGDAFRNLLSQIRMRGIPIQCEEKEGFFGSTFKIQSDMQTVVGLDKIVKNWANNARDR